MDFEYEVVPLWQQPVEPLLNGPPEVVPLAPLSRLPEGVPEAEALAEVVRQVVERLARGPGQQGPQVVDGCLRVDRPACAPERGLAVVSRSQSHA